MSLSYAPPQLQTPVPSVTFVVRPDQAHFLLAVSVETDNAAAAVPVLRRAVQRLEDLLPSLGASLKVNDFDLHPGSGKHASDPRAQVQATLVLPLAKDASFWDRATRVAQLDDLLRGLVAEGKRQKPQLEVRKGNATFVVADPEAHRDALVKVLHARARSLGAHGELLLSKLRFERAVTQRSLSLEEVEVALHLEGEAEFTL